MSTGPDIFNHAPSAIPQERGRPRLPHRAPFGVLEGEAVPSRVPLRPTIHTAHRRFALHLALLLNVVSSSAAPSNAPWRTYAVYQPRVERAVVVDAAEQPLRYNHDSSVAWFRDRWLCVWNANTIPLEGAPGQLNYQSASSDGLVWSAPQPAFSDPARNANPVPCPKGTQWQPNLLVVGAQLWCLWSQNSKDAHNGCYFSTLDAPDGLWANRLLTWEGRADPVIDGKPFRIFPTQNPLRLSTGRVLAPVTLMGPVSTNAPAGKAGWQWLEKRNSVLYTDDGGATWRVSPGTTQPSYEWRQWEPTVIEQPDGAVLMFARNNAIPALGDLSIAPFQALTWSVSRDGGATWSPHAFVPLDTVVSRMHLLRQPGSDRYFMLHNDWPAGTFGADRRNLALFVNRGGGIDFTAGLGLTDREPEVAYPQMDIHGDALLFTYSQGACGLRSIRAVRVSPLPAPDQLYLYPRSNLPPPPLCSVTNGALTLRGGRSLACRAAPRVHPDRFRLEAEINPDDDGVLVDNRGATNGFVWGLSGVAFVHLGAPDKNIRSTLPVPRGRWSHVGVAIDYPAGEVVFSVGDRTERIPFKPGRRSLAGTAATLFGPNLASSRLTAFEGEVRSLTLDGTNRLFDAAAPDPLAQYGRRYEPAALQNSSTPGRADYLISNGKPLLRLAGDASAGVELPANERKAGDAVDFEFAFRLERAAAGTLCTVGDAIQSLRVSVCGTNIVISTLNGVRACGPAAPGTWQRLLLYTQAACTRVTLDANPAVETLHTPQANWLYLGEGYPSSSPASGTAFYIDVPSIRSRVSPTSRLAP
jgi:hypothetical protein